VRGDAVKPLAVALGRGFREDRSRTPHLWRVIDHEGEVLESFVTKTRDRNAALKFLRKTMQRAGGPEIIATDLL